LNVTSAGILCGNILIIDFCLYRDAPEEPPLTEASPCKLLLVLQGEASGFDARV
jgi:hypothetical protein